MNGVEAVTPVGDEVDVVVAGGGTAGVAAAVAAARTGARTLLVEKGACLGGAATMRNVVTFCGLYEHTSGAPVVRGIAAEVIARLRKTGAVSEPTRFTSVAVVFDPESLKVVLDDLCRESGVGVRFHTLVTGAHTVEADIQAIELADHGGSRVMRASSYVDATGEADLATFAGAEIRYGNEGHVQNGTLGVRFGGIPLAIRVDREVVRAAVRRARSLGSTDLVQESGLVARLPVSGDVVTYLVDAAFDARDSLDTSRAEADARRLAQRYVEVVRSIPGCAAAYIVSTGPELGSRESRHIVAPRALTRDEVLQPRDTPDAVAVGAWPVEYHPGPGMPAEWSFIGPPGFYGIPLDCLRSVNLANLFAAGRTVDGDRSASASLRVMGTAFATGQAAGVAAAQTAHAGYCDATSVRLELDRQGANLPRMGKPGMVSVPSR